MPGERLSLLTCTDSAINCLVAEARASPVQEQEQLIATPKAGTSKGNNLTLQEDFQPKNSAVFGLFCAPINARTKGNRPQGSELELELIQSDFGDKNYCCTEITAL